MSESTWDEGFAQLERFVEREGHSRVPWDYVDDGGFHLGQWVTVQRQSRRHGQLSKEKIRRLEAVQGWAWNLFDARWDESYTRLCKFVERECHTQVPRDYREDGHRLGAWVRRQRDAYQKGELDRQRRARLEALPGWTWDAHKAGATR